MGCINEIIQEKKQNCSWCNNTRPSSLENRTKLCEKLFGYQKNSKNNQNINNFPRNRRFKKTPLINRSIQKSNILINRRNLKI